MTNDEIYNVADQLLINMHETVTPRHPGVKWERIHFEMQDRTPIVILESQPFDEGETRMEMRATLDQMMKRIQHLKDNNWPLDVSEYVLRQLQQMAGPVTA
jgi:hypothetical protein